MRKPSIKTLTPVFGERAKEARELLDQKRKTKDYQSVQHLHSTCLNKPDYHYRLMTALNEIAEAHGLETLFKRDTPRFTHLNMGDPYIATLFLDEETGRIFVSDVATVVERYRL